MKKGKHFSDNLKIIIAQPGRNILYNTKAKKQFINYIYRNKSINVNTMLIKKLVSKQMNPFKTVSMVTSILENYHRRPLHTPPS